MAAIQQRRVVITGLGAVRPLGNAVRSSCENLVAGRATAGPTTFDTTGFPVKFACETKGFDPTQWIERKQARRMDRFAQMIVAAARQAQADAGLGIEPECDRVGVSFGTAMDGRTPGAHGPRCVEGRRRGYNPRYLLSSSFRPDCTHPSHCVRTSGKGGAMSKLADPLLVELDALLDQAIRVVPRPRNNFASAIRAMHNGRYDAPLQSGRHDAPRGGFPRLQVHEMLARDITAAVDAGEPAGRESEFLERVSVRLA
jgi:hypothetical protein